MKKFIKKNPIIFSAICIALTVGLCAGLSVLTDGFETWDPAVIFARDLNTENLLYETYDDMDNTLHPSGISVEIDNGVIEFAGSIKETETAEDVEFVFATTTLEAGTYTYTCFDHPSLTTYYSMIRYTDHEGVVHVVFGDFTNSKITLPDVVVDGYKTFTLAENTEVEFVLVACVGADVTGVAARPVLVPGETAGEFYAK